MPAGHPAHSPAVRPAGPQPRSPRFSTPKYQVRGRPLPREQLPARVPNPNIQPSPRMLQHFPLSGNNPKERRTTSPPTHLQPNRVPAAQQQGASPACAPKTHPPSPYLAAVGAQGGGDGRAGEGEADSFGFSQLAKARAEPAAPLPAEPGQGTEPAAGGAPQPGRSTMALTAPAWPRVAPRSSALPVRPGGPTGGRIQPRRGGDKPVAVTPAGDAVTRGKVRWCPPARDGETRREEEGTSITPGGFPAGADLGEVVPPCLYPPRVHPVPSKPAKGYINQEGSARA